VRYVSLECVDIARQRQEPVDLHRFLGWTAREAMTLWTEGVRADFDKVLEHDFFAVEEWLNLYSMYEDNKTQAEAIQAFERMLDEEIRRINRLTDAECETHCHKTASLDDWEPLRET
jgi:hypothetical protein